MFIEDMSVCMSHETGYIILILNSEGQMEHGTFV